MSYLVSYRDWARTGVSDDVFDCVNWKGSKILWLGGPGNAFGFLVQKSSMVLAVLLELQAQAANNDFEHWENKYPGVFEMIKSKESTALHGCTSFCRIVLNPDPVKSKLPKKMVQEKISVLADLVFIRHRFFQNAWLECHGKQCLWYHTYLGPKNVELLNAFAFAYQTSLHIAEDCG